MHHSGRGVSGERLGTLVVKVELRSAVTRPPSLPPSSLTALTATPPPLLPTILA